MRRLRLRSSQVTLPFSLLLVGAFNILTLFAVYWLVLTKLGAGPESDAFFVAMVLPQLVISIAQTALTHVFIPVLAVGSPGERARDGWTFFHGTAVIFGALAALMWMTGTIWVPCLAPGLPAEHLKLAVSLMRIELIAMVFTALRAVCAAVYHANSRFLVVEISECAAGTLALIFLAALIGEYGLFAAAWAVALRYGVNVILLMPAMGRYSLPQFGLSSMRTTWSRAWPLLAGSSYTKLDIVVDRILASLVGPGLLSLLNLAQQLFGAGNLLIHKASSAPAFPRLSQLAAEGSWTEFRRLYRSRLAANAALSTSVILVLVVVGQPLLSAVLQYGEFDAGDIRQLWEIMILMCGLLIGGSMGQITSMAYYACGDTRTPTKIGMAVFTVGILLKIGGYYAHGVLGIAAATTLYYFLSLAALEFVLVRRIQTASESPA